MPKTKYAKSGDVSVAYQVMGEGPRDLVVVPGIVSNVEFWHEMPGYTRFIEQLASFARVITFDKRGSGMSDLVAGSDLRFEDRGEHTLQGVAEKWRLFSAAAHYRGRLFPTASPAITPIRSST
ncbi:MAG: alpha/beta fold hydrolase [Candidatus Krumholzibacteriia bacterium]